ncbi:MAG TPA: glycosyltransferase family 87 protein [Pirellulales bacterium]|nr:glycosyltransferase family 87 protein [Pirellulales bacterium]
MSKATITATTAGNKRRPWPLYLALAVALIAWCALDVQRRGRVDPDKPSVHKTDFTAYTIAGAAFFDGRDPYEVTNIRGWGYCYPPLFAMLVSPLDALDPRWQVSIWFFISVAVVAGLYHEGARLFKTFAALAGYQPGDIDFPRWIAWAALALTALPVMNCLQRGQVDVLKLYLLLLGIRLSITGATWRAWLAGGVAMAAAIVLKVTPALPVAFVLFVLASRLLFARSTVGDRRRASTTFVGVAAGGVTFALLVPAMLVGWQANLGYLDRFYHDKLTKANDHFESDKTGNTRSYRNQSFSNAVIRLGDFIGYEFLGGADDRLIDREWRDAPPMVMDDPGVGQVLLVARAAAVALLLLAGFLAVKRGDPLGQAAAIGLACAGSLVVSPISRGYYHTELLPGVLLLPLWLLSQNMRRAAYWMACVPVALVMAHYLALPITGRLGLLGIGTATWFATGLTMIAVGGRLTTMHDKHVPAPKVRRQLHRAESVQAGA